MFLEIRTCHRPFFLRFLDQKKFRPKIAYPLRRVDLAYFRGENGANISHEKWGSRVEEPLKFVLQEYFAKIRTDRFWCTFLFLKNVNRPFFENVLRNKNVAPFPECPRLARYPCTHNPFSYRHNICAHDKHEWPKTWHVHNSFTLLSK